MTDVGGTTHAPRLGPRAFPWGVYAGVSWTWCIGMFLPVLLWRDFTVWSFLVFAIPNIVGAALLGVVMRTPEASRSFIERHRVACVAFSAVTVWFQVFFAVWIARAMGPNFWHAGRNAPALAECVWHLGWIACVAAAVIGGKWGEASRRWAGVVGLGVWLVSIVAIARTVYMEGNELQDLTAWQGDRPLDELVPLAMVCLLGFMLCPYLDLTFHRARIESGAKSGQAFAMGFGFFFALMIVGTLLTAPVLIWLVGGSSPRLQLRPLLVPLLAAHTLPQLVYTCWVHGAELAGPRARGERAIVGWGALLTAVIALAVSGTVLFSPYHRIYPVEVVYRVFMGFYGLVAPAYVAIVAWPAKFGGAEIRRGRVAVFVAVVVGAMWFYWLGFVERQTWWVAAGVLMVVVGKLVGRFVEYKSSKLKAES